MISAEAEVMGSDNSNGSAHKHLAQFTLSNAPHGPTLSSCLSVYWNNQREASKNLKISAFISYFTFYSSVFLSPTIISPSHHLLCPFHNNAMIVFPFVSHSRRSLSNRLILPFHQVSPSTHWGLLEQVACGRLLLCSACWPAGGCLPVSACMC